MRHYTYVSLWDDAPRVHVDFNKTCRAYGYEKEHQSTIEGCGTMVHYCLIIIILGFLCLILILGHFYVVYLFFNIFMSGTYFKHYILIPVVIDLFLFGFCVVVFDI